MLSADERAVGMQQQQQHLEAAAHGSINSRAVPTAISARSVRSAAPPHGKSAWRQQQRFAYSCTSALWHVLAAAAPTPAGRNT